MSRGNLPTEPSLDFPYEEPRPESLTLRLNGVSLAVLIDWEYDASYDDGAWRGEWTPTIRTVEVADWDAAVLDQMLSDELEEYT